MIYGPLGRYTRIPHTHRIDGSTVTPGANLLPPTFGRLTLLLTRTQLTYRRRHHGHSRSASEMSKICYGNVLRIGRKKCLHRNGFGWFILQRAWIHRELYTGSSSAVPGVRLQRDYRRYCTVKLYIHA